ncbi:MAG: hypothetical protein IPM08_00370 [Actinomycetales bacterium]|nr:hypothetical protein [Actinomycetales bacterium]
MITPHHEVINQIAATDPGATILGFAAPQWDRSRLTHLLQRAELPADYPPLRAHRLRATWALAHLRADEPGVSGVCDVLRHHKSGG